MIQFEQKTFIKRSPKDVFDFLTDPANTPRYQTGTESAEWTSDGPVGVGSTWKVTTRFMGRKFDAELEITDWQPPTQNSFKAISGPIPFEGTFHVAPDGDGTLLTQKGQVEFGGFFKIAEGMLAKQLEKQIEADTHTLKLLLEDGSG